MDSNNQLNNISFFEAINKTDYAKNVKDILASLLIENFFSDKNRIFLYRQLSKTEPTKLIIMIQHKIKVNLKGHYYDIPLLIYFPDSFPLSAPNIYLEKRTNYIKINKSIPDYFISRDDLKINYQLYIKWEKEADNIIKVLDYLKDLFSKFFPLFSSKEVNNFKGYCIIDKNNIIYVNKINKQNDSLMNQTCVFNANNSQYYKEEKLEQYSTPGENDDLNTNNFPKKNSINEEKFRKNLIDKLQDILIKKIKKEYEKNESIKDQLKTYIELYNKQINEMDKIINKESNINETVNSLQNNFDEINNEIDYNKINLLLNINNSNIIDKIDNIIEIKNNKTLKRIIKINILDELFIICRNAFKKNILSLNEMIVIIRSINRNLFFLKYGIEKNPWE